MNKQNHTKPTLVTFVLDETGSMNAVRAQTISGFNEYVDTLNKADASKVSMTLTKFNSRKTEVVYSGLKIQDVPHLNEDTYVPNELTPLYDAVGKSIVAVDEHISKLRRQKRGLPKILFAIMTDGEENSSREYTRSQVFQMVQEREKQGWTFVFLGANQDAYQSAQTIGIMHAGNTMSYDVKNTSVTFASAASASAAYIASPDSSTKEFFKQSN